MNNTAQNNLVKEIRFQAKFETWLKKGDFSDQVYDALRHVPREKFVTPEQKESAWENHPLPIGYGQTISQPLMVAIMTELLELKPDLNILEVGTGSGYQSAILSYLGAEITTIEIIPELFKQAKSRLIKLGFKHIDIRYGDGYSGATDRAPFDRIILTAAPESSPNKLFEQLKHDGIMLAPIGTHRTSQYLYKGYFKDNKPTWEKLMAVAFVPLVRR